MTEKPETRRGGWSLKEDRFVHEYEAMGHDFIGGHDLNRPKGSVSRRIKKLKECGAWDAITRMKQAEKDYRIAIGKPTIFDLEVEP